MTIETTTNNLPYLGLLCSYHGAFSEFNDDDDVDQTEVFTYDYIAHNYIGMDSTRAYITGALPSIMREALEPVTEWLGAPVTLAKVGDGYSPDYYNFGGDWYDVDVVVPDNFLSRAWRKLTTPGDEFTYDDFARYLGEKYSSRDGFISFRPNIVQGWLRLGDGDERDKNEMREMMLSFLINVLSDEGDVKDSILEAWYNYSYGEHIDWKPLEIAHENLNEGNRCAAMLYDYSFEGFSKDEAVRLIRLYFGDHDQPRDAFDHTTRNSMVDVVKARVFPADWHRGDGETDESLAYRWITNTVNGGADFEDGQKWYMSEAVSPEWRDALVEIARQDVTLLAHPSQLRLAL